MAGVGQAFREITTVAEAAGLFVRPYTRSVMIAPPSHKNRFLMVLTPEAGRGLKMSQGPEAFAEFFPGLTAEHVEDVLGAEGERCFEDTELEQQVRSITEFFRELPDPPAEDGRKADVATVYPLAAAVQAGEWTTYGDLSAAAIGRSTASRDG